MFKLIADNGGGMTLQINNDYQHYYDDMSQVAQDINALLSGDDYTSWDGNALDEGIVFLDPSNDEIASGGYEIIVFDSYHDVLEWGAGHSWFNVSHLSGELDKLVMGEA